MENMKRELIEFIGLECEDHKLLLNFLISSKDELNDFLFNHYMESNPVRSVLNYKRFKRKRVKLSRSEFGEIYKLDKKKALESLFQEPIALYVDVVPELSISYTEIYSSCKNDISMSLGDLIDNIKPKAHDDSFLLMM